MNMKKHRQNRNLTTTYIYITYRIKTEILQIQHGTDYKTGLRLSVNLSWSVYPSSGTLTVAFLDQLSPKLVKT